MAVRAPGSGQRGGTGRKVALSVALVGAALGALVGGAMATFTSAASGGAAQIVGAGTVALTASPSTLGTGATAIAPGDWIDRTVTLNNTGNLKWNAVTLGVVDSQGSPNLTGGYPAGCTPACGTSTELQLGVYQCSVPWTSGSSGSPPPTQDICSGTKTTLLAATPASAVSGSTLAFAAIDPLLVSPGSSSAYLVVELTFPSSAPNQYQGLSSTLAYTFTATQRAAQSD
jgi:spore coat-associated protein N